MQGRGTEERENKREVGTGDGRYIIVHHIKKYSGKDLTEHLYLNQIRLNYFLVETGVGLLSGQPKTSNNDGKPSIFLSKI